MTFREDIQKAVGAKKIKDSERIENELRELTEKVKRDWKVLFGEELLGIRLHRKKAASTACTSVVFSRDDIEFCIETWGERHFPDYKLVKKCNVCGTEYYADLFFDRGTPDEPGKYREANLATIGNALETEHSAYLCKSVLDNSAGITTESKLVEAIREFIQEQIPTQEG